MANALQKIITTAKGLQRKNKNLSWKDAIKKASAMYRASNKPAAKKKAVKKKSVGKKPSIAKKRAVKRSATRKGKKIAARKKSAPRAKHIDTKSHNVNIRVLSGADSSKLYHKRMREIKIIMDNIAYDRRLLESCQDNLRTAKAVKDKHKIAHYTKTIASLKKHIKAENIHFTNLRKYI